MLYACAILLLVASIPSIDLPYGFYSILRIIVCVTFSIIMFRQMKNDEYNLITISVVILFNPVFIVAMDKETWQLTDIAVFIYTLYILRIYHKENKKIENIVSAVLVSAGAADIFETCFKSFTGVIEKPTEAMKKMTEKFDKYWDEYEIDDAPKYKLNPRYSDVYICKHIFQKYASKPFPSGEGFIDYIDGEYTEEMTLESINNLVNGDLYLMFSFIFDDRSLHIDMDAFNKYILPQLKEATKSELLYTKLSQIKELDN